MRSFLVGVKRGKREKEGFSLGGAGFFVLMVHNGGGLKYPHEEKLQGLGIPS